MLFSSAILVTISDIKHCRVSNRLNLIIFIMGVFYVVLIGFKVGKVSLEPAISVVIGGGTLFILDLLKQVGGGDVKYMLGASLFLRPNQVLVALLLAFIIGGILSIYMLIVKKKSVKMKIPLCPFLAFGVCASYLFV